MTRDEAIWWAMRQQPARALAKLVLLVMAMRVQENGRCWMTQRTMERLTGMNRKSIKPTMELLERQGLLVDTGERAGVGAKTKVYKLGVGNPHPVREPVR